jgi:NitT/TauT family transport system ATP-binding protein
LQDELARSHAAPGKTIVFVTHSIDEAVHLADEVVVLAGKPARLAAAHVINAPRPRRRNAAETADLVARMRVELGETA